MDLFTILVAVLAVLVVTICLYLTRNRGLIEKLGIPIDPSYLVFGSEPRALHKVFGKVLSVNREVFKMC